MNRFWSCKNLEWWKTQTFLSSIVWEAFGIKCRWLNWTEFHCFTSFHFIKARLKENNLNREYIPFLMEPQLKTYGHLQIVHIISKVSAMSHSFFSFSLLKFRGTGSHIFCGDEQRNLWSHYVQVFQRRCSNNYTLSLVNEVK